ncbi:Protein CBG08924 [Caenorhabditis briggsae]|uniref:Protein CBG08924 n=1 Tax=Caenorhabditis briggsae TaxID=6238 RepID=A8X7P8_CAEBR|nr:Protein CBG08924 [Caenorhabditis briggsae]CAP28659.2 Protein CBG08924 [Caenorhabditis briggsae]
MPVFAVPVGRAPRKRCYSDAANEPSTKQKMSVESAPCLENKPGSVIPPITSIPDEQPPRLLLSKKEVYDLAGKVRTLTKLMKHPRAAIPEHKNKMVELHNYLQAVVAAKWTIATTETICNHKYVCDNIQKSEEVVIRCVVLGEDYTTVTKEVYWEQYNVIQSYHTRYMFFYKYYYFFFLYCISYSMF